MTPIKTKKDFIAIISVTRANPNGDPTASGRPRVDWMGHGVITDVCIKRLIRNRLQEMGHEILYQSDGRETDSCRSIADRFKTLTTEPGETTYDALCRRFADVRAFGAVVAYSNKAKASDKKAKAKKREEGDTAEKVDENNESSVSLKVRGCVSIQDAVSVAPIDIEEVQIAKSLNGTPAEEEGRMTSDRLGWRYRVPHALYVVRGSINPFWAAKTGFSENDAEALKRCVATLFENSESTARPIGSMKVENFYWVEHNSKIGISSAKVFDAIKVGALTDEPTSADDYIITVDEEALAGATVERVM